METKASIATELSPRHARLPAGDPPCVPSGSDCERATVEDVWTSIAPHRLTPCQHFGQGRREGQAERPDPLRDLPGRVADGDVEPSGTARSAATPQTTPVSRTTERSAGEGHRRCAATPARGCCEQRVRCPRARSVRRTQRSTSSQSNMGVTAHAGASATTMIATSIIVAGFVIDSRHRMGLRPPELIEKEEVANGNRGH